MSNKSDAIDGEVPRDGVSAAEAARLAAAALERGDPIGALQRVALRTEPAALALAGSALARLQDWDGAKRSLRQAAKLFRASGSAGRADGARCEIAQAEVGLLARELGHDEAQLTSAIAHLDGIGDHHNARYGRLVLGRCRVLVGRTTEALAALEPLDGLGSEALSPALRTLLHIVRAEALIRSARAREAQVALVTASDCASTAGDPALIAEVRALESELSKPAARWIHGASERTCTLAEIESLLTQHSLVVDGCRRRVRSQDGDVDLRSRAVLFELVVTLAPHGATGVSRQRLIQSAFEHGTVNDELRVRLRVEIGRLREALGTIVEVVATESGYALVAEDGLPVPVLAPPTPGRGAAVEALLSDGAAWSTGALAAVLAQSRRTIQRELQGLTESGHVIALGSGPARRWRATPPAAIATALLLPHQRPTH